MRALRFFRKRSPRFFFLLRIKGDLKQAKQKDFVPAKLTTADDDAGNLQSLNRKLTQRLYLTVRRGPKAWLFPQRVTPDSETMRQVRPGSNSGAILDGTVYFLVLSPLSSSISSAIRKEEEKGG